MPWSLPRRIACCISFFGLIGLISASSAQAQTCAEDLTCQYLNCRTPASGAPAQLWGELKPVDLGQLPAARDNSNFNEFGDPFNETEPLWMSLDIENGWIFTAINAGLQVWNSNGSPTNPTRSSVVGRSGFPVWTPDPHEFYPVRDVDAPPGNDNVVAVAVTHEAGVVIFNTAVKTSPTARYADTGKWAEQVYAAHINGVDYAFAATKFTGLLSYNMTAAQARTTLCTESTPGSTCGVYVSKLGSHDGFSYVDGVGNANGTAHWVVGAFSGADRGLEIFNVSNPSTPQSVVTGLTTELGVHGVAMWRRGSSYYLATRVIVSGGTQARIYDVSCIAGNSCSSLGSPIWTANLPDGGAGLFLTYSESASGRPFVYFGDVNKCGSGLQHEWLYDVSNPAAPQDITPPPADVNGQLTGYWGWYYRRNPTGFNSVMPRVGKFNGNYFYRAAFGIFDIHELTSGGPPVAAFTYSPNPPYAGQPVNFTDSSTGVPNGWNWTFTGGTPGTSTQQNPTGVVFASNGTHAVTLRVTNNFGNNSTTQNINVLDPTPSVASVGVSPNPALVCQPITFTANTVTGFPAPALSWVVKDGSGGTVTTGGNVNPFVWTTTGALAGNYTATVTATNTAGSDSATSSTLVLNQLPQLPGAGTFTPTNDAFTNGTVQFHVVAAGATEWNWSFGDDTTTGWINDPVNGPNPVHTYQSVGTYQVTVQVRNCVEAARTSAALSVHITQITPLVASFQASGIFCTGNGCFANVGPISFVDTSLGNPQFWDYDWAGDGTYEDANHTSPVTSHSYSAAGTYTPKLRVRRGAELDEFTHIQIIVSTGGGGGGTPSASITGPSSGQTSQALSYSATVSNCANQPTTWSWTVPADGTINGANNGATISVTFSSAGSKTISATAGTGGCTGSAGLSATKGVTISQGGGGGGGGNLNAAFTFTPTSPNVGQQVSFDAATSTGSPTGYTWHFGDGGMGNGVQINHTYAQAGTYTVTLEISRPDTGGGAGCSFGFCTDSESHMVVVGGGGGGGVIASFTTSATCDAFVCRAQRGQQLSFTATSQGATTHEWNFGDGGAAAGSPVNHTFNQVGSFNVVLTSRNAENVSATASKVFEISQPATTDRMVVVPWAADTSGAIDQVTDLFVTNPGTAPMEVEITFRKRGIIAEDNPPHATRTIPAKGTLLVPSVLATLFSRTNTYGYLVIVAHDATVNPVAVAYNRTFQDDGSTFGQAIQGYSTDDLAQLTANSSGKMTILGLHDTNERVSLFGITNPSSEPLVYRLRFVDKLGAEISSSATDLAIGGWGQKQFQPAELRSLFGIQGMEDFRMELTKVSGGDAFPYVDLIREGTQDPSFVRVVTGETQRSYMVCGSSTPGVNNSLFQTDVLLSNPTDQLMQIDVAYRNVGPNSQPLPPETITLQPNETRRENNIVFSLFGLTNNVGLLTFESLGAAGKYPLIQGETYQNSGPLTRFGFFMPVRNLREAASPGENLYVTGLKQKAGESTTTLWLFNPDEVNVGFYDLIFRALDGTEINRFEDYAVPPGAVRQINPAAIPLPVGGVDGGFALEAVVQAGKLIVGGQVVINQTNDPAYVTGLKP